MSSVQCELTQPAESTSPTIAAIASEGRESVQRMMQSRHFRKAPLLSAFLLHIVERALSSPGDRITEHEIGMLVFRRPRSFDPRQDNIVRTYARQLRKRLEEYYGAEGAKETVRILLPRGGYTPMFTRFTQPETVTATPFEQSTLHEADDLSAPATSVARMKLWTWVGLSIFVCSCIFATVYQARNSAALRKQRPPSPLHRMWAQMFSAQRNTLVVPNDIGFVILQQANHRTFTLAEYLGWQAANQTPDNLTLAYLKDQSYTSMLNLNTVLQIHQLPEVISDRFEVRAPRVLRLEDLVEDDAIIIGSNLSNPWAELYSPQLNFQFVNHPESDQYWISNRQPMPSEQSIYTETSKSFGHRTYGVIAFVPNAGKAGHVLLIAGLDAAGTQAATNLLFQTTEALSSIVAEASKPDGSIRSFEVLLEATSLGFDSRAVDCRIIAKRIHL